MAIGFKSGVCVRPKRSPIRAVETTSHGRPKNPSILCGTSKWRQLVNVIWHSFCRSYRAFNAIIKGAQEILT